jgi:putative ABC transport system substrate-binding protein
MSTRRQFLGFIGVGAFWPAGFARANSPKKIARLGFLSSGNHLDTPQYAAFVQGLRELGYEEGRNLRIEHRWIDRDLKRMPALATELVKLPVDVLVAWSSPAVAAAKRATTITPIVMIAVSDPVGQGFVASLAKPGGNITGMSNLLRGTIAKNVEMLIKFLPGARRLVALRNPDNPSHEMVLQEAQAAARDYGATLQTVSMSTPTDVDGAFAAIRKDRAAGMVIFGDPLFVQQRTRIAELAIQARLPSTTIFRQYPEAGGLMSYGLNNTDMFRRSAHFVDKILKGARPADLPVEQPTTFEMVINLKTARTIGVPIPESVLLRADKVIE